MRQEYPGAALTKANREIAVTLNTKIVESATVDLMFVVDATGSMGDEIIYLKNELKDVLSRAARQVPGRCVMPVYFTVILAMNI